MPPKTFGRKNREGEKPTKKAPFRVPTVKKFYIELKKDEKILVLFAHYLACKV